MFEAEWDRVVLLFDSLICEGVSVMLLVHEAELEKGRLSRFDKLFKIGLLMLLLLAAAARVSFVRLVPGL